MSIPYTSDGLNGYSTFELKMRFSANEPSNIPKAIISTGKNIPQTSRALQEIIKDRYVYQRALLDEVVYNILYTASDKPLNKRINFKQLDLFLKTELLNNGIDIPYHFTVTDREGRKFTIALIIPKRVVRIHIRRFYLKMILRLVWQQ